MKPTQQQIFNLARRLESERVTKGLSYANISRSTGVDPSQVLRICRGEFRTVSLNVMQICTYLGVPPQYAINSDDPSDASWHQLTTSIRKLWDRTPQDADRIITILEKIAEFRSD